MSAIEERLNDLGLGLPLAAAPAANYVPFVVTGNLVVISGQLPIQGGGVAVRGRLGDAVGVEEGQAAARLCLLNVLAQLKVATDGDLDRVKRCVRLGGFVSCTSEFIDHPKVVNGASDLLVEVMGEAGHHARAAVGCPSLPLDAAVEVEAIFELG